MSRGRARRSAGAALALLGGVTVLAITFGAGFFTGQRWSRVGGSGPVDAEPEGSTVATSRGRSAQGPSPQVHGADAASTVPEVTFYRELTAPVPAGPSSSRRGPASASGGSGAMSGASRATRAPRPAVSPRGESSAPRGASAPVTNAAPAPDAAPQSSGFTVQVAAYSTRAQAETLKQALAARGLDVGVSETSTAAGTRYRVRVGAFPTRSAAEEAAGRVAAETRLGTYVAPR
jgi:cell division protein FtsN